MSFEFKIMLFGALLVVLGIPLALNWVPQNPVYGIRTAKTFASREVWYAANRLAGLNGAVAGIAIAVAALVVPRVVPDYSEGVRVLIVGAITTAAVVIMVTRIVVQIRRL
jgi:uncharacterized membrane protein